LAHKKSPSKSVSAKLPKNRRQDTVKATIYVGAPFGGCAATTWLNQLSGDFFKLLPVLTNLMPASLTGKFHPTVVGTSVYRMAFGLPTWGWMLPRPSVLGKDHVSFGARGRTVRRRGRGGGGG
jgi:hypothetical protein